MASLLDGQGFWDIITTDEPVSWHILPVYWLRTQDTPWYNTTHVESDVKHYSNKKTFHNVFNSML